jgi:hypothetical protein
MIAVALMHRALIRTLALYFSLEVEVEVEVEVVTIVMIPIRMKTLMIQLIGVIQMIAQMMTIAMKIIMTVLALRNLGKPETHVNKLSIDLADIKECSDIVQLCTIAQLRLLLLQT